MNSHLRRRTLAGAVFVLLVIGLAYPGGVAFLFLVSTIVGAGLVEFFKLARGWGASPFMRLGTVLGLAVVFCTFVWGSAGQGGAAAAATVLCMGAPLVCRSKLGPGDSAATALGVLYVGLLGSYMVALRQGPGSAGLDYSLGFAAVMTAFASTWCCDTAAYLIGGAFGRHKLLPVVSPNKTWEGAAAGLLGAVLGVAIVRLALGRPGDWVELIAVGLGIGVLALAGDLVESKLKREAGCKDSSALIPGHGGVLDRFDGLLFAAPALYYYLAAVDFAGLR